VCSISPDFTVIPNLASLSRQTSTGEAVFDFGQNMVGRVRFKLSGKKGRYFVVETGYENYVFESTVK